MSRETFDREDFKENERQSRARLDKLKRTWGMSNGEERRGMISRAERYVTSHKSSRDPNEQSQLDAFVDFLDIYK